MPRAHQIRAFSAELARRFHPEKIVLFGSQAARKATADSDVDLLVVMPHEGPAAAQAARIRNEVRAPFALDLIVRSPETVRRRLSWGDPFICGILDGGEVLYESTR